MKESFSTTSDMGLTTERPARRGTLLKPVHLGLLIGFFLVLALACGLIGHFATDCSCSDPLIPTTTTEAPTDLPTTPIPPPRDHRLPGDLLPVHYDVEWRPHIYTEEEFYFEGHVDIYFRCIESTNVIKLNVKQLNYSVETLSPVSGTFVPEIQDTEEDVEILIMSILLSGSLEAGEQYVLSIKFNGALNPDLAGLYLDQYTDQTGNIRYLALTQFAASDARKAFPCMDEPGIKATFNVTVVRQDSHHALSNMPLLYTESREGDWVADHFERTPVMSAYTLAIFVSDFVNINETTSDGDLVRIWTRPGSQELGRYALRTAVRAQEYFTQYMSLSAGVPKMDHVAVPNFNFGAMENWGLIIYREQRLLYNELESTSSQRRGTAVIISHEVAHQWVGNRVTCAWWTEVTVNEGMASFFENIGLRTAEPDWDPDEILMDSTQSLWGQDSRATSQPISVNVTRPQEHNSVYSYAAYGKGAYVLWMLQGILTPEFFQEGIQVFLGRYSHQAAYIADLWDVMTEVAANHSITEPDGSALDVRAKLDSWVLQMGYPQVWVGRQGDSITASLNQTHYLQDPDTPVTTPSPYDYKWNIPITYMSSDEPNDNFQVRRWLDRTNGSVEDVLPAPAPGGWFLVNVGRRGLYRVRYDQELRQALVSQLDTNASVIPVFNRAQFLDDLFSMARSGQFLWTEALEATRYLDGEQEYLPWDVTMRHLDVTTRVLSNLPVYANLQKYVLLKLVPLYEYVGWDFFNTTADIIESYKRVLAVRVACEMLHPDCLSAANTQYTSWREDPDVNRLHPDERPTVLCTVVREGGSDEFWEVLEELEKAHTSAKGTFATSLACSQRPWLLQSLLEMSLDSNHTLSEYRQSIFTSVAQNNVGSVLVWEYLVTNWNDTPLATGKRTVLNQVVQGFHTAYQLAQVRWFLTTVSSPADVAAVEQAVAVVEGNQASLKTNLPALEHWLEQEIQA